MEAYLLDVDSDLYGRRMRLEFVDDCGTPWLSTVSTRWWPRCMGRGRDPADHGLIAVWAGHGSDPSLQQPRSEVDARVAQPDDPADVVVVDDGSRTPPNGAELRTWVSGGESHLVLMSKNVGIEGRIERWATPDP